MSRLGSWALRGRFAVSASVHKSGKHLGETQKWSSGAFLSTSRPQEDPEQCTRTTGEGNHHPKVHTTEHGRNLLNQTNSNRTDEDKSIMT